MIGERETHQTDGSSTYLVQPIFLRRSELRGHLPSTLVLLQRPLVDLETHPRQQCMLETSSWHWRSLLAIVADTRLRLGDHREVADVEWMEVRQWARGLTRVEGVRALEPLESGFACGAAGGLTRPNPTPIQRESVMCHPFHGWKDLQQSCDCHMEVGPECPFA